MIITNAKRGVGKYKQDCNFKDSYKIFKESNNEKINYKLYTHVLDACNKLICKKILEESEEFLLPYKLGKLRITKFEKHFNPDKKNKWKVNYQESKKQGMIIYYGDEYGYRWKWDKKGVPLKNKNYYKFVTTRDNSRAINVMIKQFKRDYYK